MIHNIYSATNMALRAWTIHIRGTRTSIHSEVVSSTEIYVCTALVQLCPIYYLPLSTTFVHADMVLIIALRTGSHPLVLNREMVSWDFLPLVSKARTFSKSTEHVTYQTSYMRIVRASHVVFYNSTCCIPGTKAVKTSIEWFHQPHLLSP